MPFEEHSDHAGLGSIQTGCANVETTASLLYKNYNATRRVRCECSEQTKNSSNLSAADDLPHFKDLFGNVNTNNEGTHQPDGLLEYEMLSREFNVEEIQTVIKSLKSNKACGIDDIIGEIFENSYDLIQPFILKLFNILFKNCIYPESWCPGIISPIHKMVMLMM